MNLYMLICFQRETLPVKSVSTSSLKHNPNAILGTKMNNTKQTEIKIKIGSGTGIFTAVFSIESQCS